MIGHWNFLEDHNSIRHIRCPDQHNTHHSAEEVLLWRSLIARLTLLEIPEPTHFWRDQFTALDRCYTSMSAWQIQQLVIRTFVSDPPQLLRKKLISDHAAISSHVSCRCVVPSKLRPLPPEVNRHPLFAANVNAKFHYFGVDPLQAVERWQVHKDIIKDSARETRSYILATDSDCAISRDLCLGSLARAFWRNDMKFAASVLSNFAPGREVLSIGTVLWRF